MTLVLPTLADPKYIDLALAEINTKLSSTFSWLDNTFGLAQRLPMFRGNYEDPRFNAHDYYPGIFKGGDQDNYISMLPNEDYGNYCFWDLEDDYEKMSRTDPNLVRKIGFVIWFKYPDIFGASWENYTINNVKALLIDNFFEEMYFTKSIVDVFEINERVEHIYKTYNHSEITSQFLMKPYGGLRINMTIYINRLTLC